uniref:Glycoprotein n=1 Tax=Wenling frogfish arenavirus 2 TaxID=2116467 RepID=A0A2P1GNR5_9VIRU|nr:glycoprotein [Wenling frogfish arenavirus 2]
MFESIIDPILEWLFNLFSFILAVIFVMTLSLLIYRMRNLPFLFMMCGSAECWVSNIQMNGHTAEMRQYEGQWLCGKIKMIKLDDLYHIRYNMSDSAVHLVMSRCTNTKLDNGWESVCSERPALLKNISTGISMIAGFNCSGQQKCFVGDGCTPWVDARDICGRKLERKLDNHQMLDICRQPIVGWIDSDGVHGRMQPIDKSTSVKETDSTSSGGHWNIAGRCSCIAYHQGVALPPITLKRHNSFCAADEWFSTHPKVGTKVCISADSLAVNFLKWSMKVMNHKQDIIAVEKGGTVNYIFTKRAKKVFISAQMKGKSCIPGNKTGDYCQEKVNGCEKGCWNLPKSRTRQRRQSILFFWGLVEVKWGEGGEVYDDSVLKALASQVDLNTASVKKLQLKLDLLSKAIWNGFCTNGTHSVQANMTITFKDGDELVVLDWCNSNTLEAFIDSKSVQEHHLSDLVKVSIRMRIHQKRVTIATKLGCVLFGLIVCTAVLRALWRRKDFSLSHYHEEDLNGQTCYSHHRFEKRYSRACRCGNVVIGKNSFLKMAKCNNRSKLPDCLLMDDKPNECDVLDFRQGQQKEVISDVQVIEFEIHGDEPRNEGSGAQTHQDLSETPERYEIAPIVFHNPEYVTQFHPK